MTDNPPFEIPKPLGPSFWRAHRGAVLYHETFGHLHPELAAYPLWDTLDEATREEWKEKAELARQQEDWSPRGPWVVWSTDADSTDRLFDSVLNPWRDPQSESQDWTPRSFSTQEEAEVFAKKYPGCLRIITGPPLFTFPPEQTS